MRSVTIPAAHVRTIGATLILLATVLASAGVLVAAAAVDPLGEDIARGDPNAAAPIRARAGPEIEARKGSFSSACRSSSSFGAGNPRRHVLDEISKSLPDRLWLTT